MNYSQFAIRGTVCSRAVTSRGGGRSCIIWMEVGTSLHVSFALLMCSILRVRVCLHTREVVVRAGAVAKVVEVVEVESQSPGSSGVRFIVAEGEFAGDWRCIVRFVEDGYPSSL